MWELLGECVREKMSQYVWLFVYSKVSVVREDGEPGAHWVHVVVVNRQKKRRRVDFIF
jgi:hypothetical protein